MYFDDCKTVEEIKNRFRKLARQHHPDLGRCEETMKAINNAYDEALKRADGQTRTRADDSTWTYRYDPEQEKAAMEMILKVIALDMHAVEVWLIGTWIWVKGDTKPHKDKLNRKNGLGFSWHKTRKCWYWKPDGQRGYRSKRSLDEIGAFYGAKNFSGKQKAGKKARVRAIAG